MNVHIRDAGMMRDRQHPAFAEVDFMARLTKGGRRYTFLEVPSSFTVTALAFQSSCGVHNRGVEASIKIHVHDGERRLGIYHEAGDGNGASEAFYNVLKKTLRPHFPELEELELLSLKQSTRNVHGQGIVSDVRILGKWQTCETDNPILTVRARSPNDFYASAAAVTHLVGLYLHLKGLTPPVLNANPYAELTVPK